MLTVFGETPLKRKFFFRFVLGALRGMFLRAVIAFLKSPVTIPRWIWYWIMFAVREPNRVLVVAGNRSRNAFKRTFGWFVTFDSVENDISRGWGIDLHIRDGVKEYQQVVIFVFGVTPTEVYRGAGRHRGWPGTFRVIKRSQLGVRFYTWRGLRRRVRR
jgi:hypothetical protein